MSFSRARFARCLPVVLLVLFTMALPAAQAQRASLSPSSLTFGSFAVGSASPAQTITVSNSSSTALKVTSISVSGDYSQTNTCGTSLAGHGSCTISVTFTATATGRRRGTLTMRDNANNSPQTASLTGTGVAATASINISPTSLTFPAQTVGTTSSAQPITLTNTGTSSFTLSSISISGNFARTTTCGSSLGAGASCSISVTFTPTATGTRTGTVSFTAGSSAKTVSLTGTGVAAASSVTVSPITLSFAAQNVGATSGSQPVSLKNNTAASLAISISSSGDFAQTNNCTSVGAGATCTASVTFTPTASGTRTGSLTITYSGTGSPQSVSLTGTGNAVTSGPCTAPVIDLKLLVVSSGKTEADYGAITQILNYVGTPYTVLDFKATPSGLTAGLLSDGACHGYFQGVIFANGGYIYTLQNMATLTAYEQKFGIRQLNWFASPTADFGLSTANKTLSSSTTYSANFTPAAAGIFPAINTSTPLAFSNASIYLAQPGAGNITPLLTDAAGNVLSVIYDQGDGREYLTQTFDSNQYLMHDLVVAYSLLNWVTKGTFLGEYHVYASPQVDDVFIDDAEWVAGTSCGTDSDAASLPNFRLNAADIDSIIGWQSAKQSNPLLSNFVLSLAFNGIGTTGDNDYTGLPNGATDTLTPELQKYQASFNWISHTWDHPDSLNGMSQAMIDGEVNPNNAEAATLGFTHFNTGNMVTPGVTGLNDTKVPGELVKDGIRYVVTDTSVIGQVNNGPNPSPNVGIVNSYATQLYEVPRHANNLFFNVATPSDWTAEYHCIYAGQAPYSTYTYQQIQDYISASFVVNMLMGDMDPEMFHQPNLHNYDGLGHSLLGDLYDETFTSYFKLYKLPVLSPSLDVLALNMQSRNTYNLSGVTASVTGGDSPTISITVPAGGKSALIPVTGLNSAGAEVYGGQNISHITVNAGQTITLPME